MQHERKSENQGKSLDSLDDEEMQSRYLVFELGNERYASPILQIREVIKVPVIKPVPFMVSSFTGVLNLRGQMIGVVDLRQRFQIPIQDGKKGIILIVDLGGSLLAAQVDDVNAVANVPEDRIRKDISVETRCAIEFLTGMTEIDKRIVNLIDLSRLLSSQELKKIGDTVRAA